MVLLILLHGDTYVNRHIPVVVMVLHCHVVFLYQNYCSQQWSNYHHRWYHQVLDNRQYMQDGHVTDVVDRYVDIVTPWQHV